MLTIVAIHSEQNGQMGPTWEIENVESEGLFFWRLTISRDVRTTTRMGVQHPVLAKTDKARSLIMDVIWLK